MSKDLNKITLIIVYVLIVPGFAMYRLLEMIAPRYTREVVKHLNKI